MLVKKKRWSVNSLWGIYNALFDRTKRRLKNKYWKRSTFPEESGLEMDWTMVATVPSSNPAHLHSPAVIWEVWTTM